MKKIKQLSITLILLSIIIVSCKSPPKENTKFLNLLKQSSKSEFYLDTIYIEQRARTHVINGSKYQQQNKHPEAIIEFQQAARLDSNAAVFYAMAKSYMGMQLFDLAYENILIALNKEPEFLAAIELLAEIYLYKYEISNAIITLERYLELSPSKDKLYSLARIYEFTDINKAIEIYEELAKDTNEPSILQRLNILYEQTNNSEKYIENLKELFELNPTNVRNSVTLMEYYLEEQDYEQAFALMEKLDKTQTNEDLAMFYGMLSTDLLNDFDNNVDGYILKILDKIDERFYFDWRLNMLKIFLADRIGEKELAEQYIIHTLKLVDNDNPELPVQLGLYYLRNNNFEKAIEFYLEYEEVYPEDWRFSYYAALGYLSLEKFAEADTLLKKALLLDNENIDVLTQLGYTSDKLDDINASDKYYERALEIEPSNPLVNNNYAYSLSVRGIKLQQALIMSTIALEYDSTNSAYLDTYGWIKYQMGDYNAALYYISKAIEVGGATAEVYQNLGNVYVQLNEIEKAVESFEKAKELEPARQDEINKILEKLK